MNKMNKIPVEDLKTDMIFDKPLYIDSSNMLVGANVALKESDIKKLMTWGVSEVETAGTQINKEDGNADVSGQDSEKRIVAEYNDLLKKRKNMIEVHTQACNAVNAIYEAVKSDLPFSMTDLDKSLKSIISLLKENSNVFIFLYGLDEGKDPLVVHSVNVTFYSLLIGLALKFPENKLRELGFGTLLIDAGMIKIPVYIMHKQSNLTDQELKQIKTHPVLGFKELQKLGDVSDNIANVSLQHHEMFDGKGYPRGLKGYDISEYARIAAIADAYEAQITSRSYRKKMYFYHAMRNLLSSGVNQFDPVILRVFLSRMSVYPIGSLVQLNDASTGIVVGSIAEKPLRPIVKVIFDKDGNRLQDTLLINLIEESSVYITKALDENDLSVNIFDVL